MKTDVITAAGMAGSMASGFVGAISVWDVESAAMLLSVAASTVVLLAGVWIYISREWRLKLIITPLFVSCAAYMSYVIWLPPNDVADYAMQALDSIGIITLILYLTWNRRSHGKSQKETTQSEEKAHPTQKMNRLIHFISTWPR